MEKILIVANWKCNPTTLKEAQELFDLIGKGIGNIKNVEVIICPPFVYLTRLLDSESYILNPKFGAQDCFWEEKGAFTGEISALMLKNLNCQYVIVGHSERRRYFNETDEMINRKLKSALAVGLNPILCIGETDREREAGKTQEILEKQLNQGLKDMPESLILNSKLAIAYEPVWAIGTGNACSAEEARKVSLLIRQILAELYEIAVPKNFQIIYGGSVNSQNASGFIKEAQLQGLLVGGASLDATEFIEIIKTVS